MLLKSCIMSLECMFFFLYKNYYINNDNDKYIYILY